MATNHTENYNLNLWEPTDKFVREEFNENTSKIDAAIKAVDAKANTKADQTALTAETNARTAAVNSINSALSGKARIAAGTYTGDGNATQTVYVGFTPRAVLVTYCSGATTSSVGYFGGLAVSGSPTRVSGVESVAVTSGGFKVAYNSAQKVFTNESGYSYQYLALA